MPTCLLPDLASPALDYALLRIDGRPGDDIVDSAQNQRRGCRLSPIPAEFVAEMPLLLLGHPRGDSLKLTLDTQSLNGVGAGGSRLRYRTNSEPGSSGSACSSAMEPRRPPSRWRSQPAATVERRDSAGGAAGGLGGEADEQCVGKLATKGIGLVVHQSEWLMRCLPRQNRRKSD